MMHAAWELLHDEKQEKKPIVSARRRTHSSLSLGALPFLRPAPAAAARTHINPHTRNPPPALTAAMADDAPPPAAGPGPGSTGAAGAPAAAETDAPAVLFKRPAARARGNLRRNRAGGGGGADSDEDDDGGAGGGPAAAGLAKRARPSAAAPLVASTRDAAPGGGTADLLPARYGGDRTRQSGRDDLATAQLETETEFDRDNR